jgi:hypothetical protein
MKITGICWDVTSDTRGFIWPEEEIKKAVDRVQSKIRARSLFNGGHDGKIFEVGISVTKMWVTDTGEVRYEAKTLKTQEGLSMEEQIVVGKRKHKVSLTMTGMVDTAVNKETGDEVKICRDLDIISVYFYWDDPIEVVEEIPEIFE